MKLKIRIQDPTNPPRNPLLDELITLVSDGKVQSLRMFFGFLTGSGVSALQGTPEVEDVLLHSNVEVLVGLNAVTDCSGLEQLLELARRNPNFKPLVIKNTSGILIHPKMLVVKYEDGRGVAVVGSNNLTLYGLTGNVEGYAIASFEPGEHMDLTDWDEFMSRWSAQISEIDDEALEAAKQNERRLKRMGTTAKRRGTRAKAGIVVSDGQAFEMPLSGAEELEELEELLLVAQIGKGGNRWSQVHYTKDIITNFFKLEGGDQVSLREFDSPFVEQPRVVYSRGSNKNHKIELRAASKAGKYPADGQRPLVIFRRESAPHRRYRYVLLMPGDAGHPEMTALVEADYDGPSNQLFRVLATRTRVMNAWPECPL